MSAIPSKNPANSLVFCHLKDDLHGRAIGYGQQSQVELLEKGHLKMPIILKRMGIGKQLTYKEADSLRTHLYAYRNVLERSGWNIPSLYDAAVYEGKSGAYITSFEEYISGQSISKILQSDSYTDGQRWKLFEQLFSLLVIQKSRVLFINGKKLHRLPYGVDLKPHNLILTSAMRIYLVDTFGPKTIDDKGKWASYGKKLENLDEEALMAVTATREGIILRFLRLSGMESSVEPAKNEIVRHLQTCLLNAGISSCEREFIIDEVKNNYPWFDDLYAKHYLVANMGKTKLF